ncbi:MAG: response regulator [Gemmataceae bacterium]
MADVIRIVIVDPSDMSREELRNALLGMESVWLDSECRNYDFALDLVTQSPPDAVLVSLDSDQNKAIALIQHFSEYLPQMSVLAASARSDGQAILQALRAGAREFLTLPIQPEELVQTLRKVTGQHHPHHAPSEVTTTVRKREPSGKMARPQGQIVSVLGSRGGVGGTSIAVNLGATLAQYGDLNVAMLDLDLAMGDADIHLDLLADYSLLDLAVKVDALDQQYLRQCMKKHACGLWFLQHPENLIDLEAIREDILRRIIKLLQTSYAYLMVDLSKSFNAVDQTVLEMSNLILVVIQLDLSSVRNAVRILQALATNEALTEKVRIILNNVGGEPDIPLKKAEETLGHSVYWQIPHEASALKEAKDNGQPLVQYAIKSKAQQAFFGLAKELTGRECPVQPREKSRGWSSIFSRK